MSVFAISLAILNEFGYMPDRVQTTTLRIQNVNKAINGLLHHDTQTILILCIYDVDYAFVESHGSAVKQQSRRLPARGQCPANRPMNSQLGLL